MNTMIALWLSIVPWSVAPGSSGATPVRLAPFEQVASGAWQVRCWADRPFVFLSYGDWGKPRGPAGWALG
ncbi:MAG: hypothetical protein NTY19_42770 [Planctomycetota bacterium]|nr:hypothetical protein [Planctomycetota bacterium]